MKLYGIYGGINSPYFNLSKLDYTGSPSPVYFPKRSMKIKNKQNKKRRNKGGK